MGGLLWNLQRGWAVVSDNQSLVIKMDILLYCLHLFTLILQATTAFLNYLLKRAVETSGLATALEDSTRALVSENRAMTQALVSENRATTQALTTLTESQVSLTEAVTQALVNHTRAMVRFRFSVRHPPGEPDQQEDIVLNLSRGE